MRQSQLQVLLALIAILGLVEAQVTVGYVKQSEGVLRGALERRQIENLEVMYKEAYILKSLDESKLESLSQPLCALLQLSNPKVDSISDAFYLLKLKNILSSPCSLASQKAIESTLSNEFESIQTAEQVLYVVALAAELNQTSILKAACIVAPSYLQLDGTAKSDFTNPNSSDYYSSGLIIEAIQICIEGEFLSFETLKKQLDISLESILLNSVLIEPKRRVVMHNMQTLELTAKLTKLFTVFPNKSIAAFTSFEKSYRNTFLNFVKNEANSNLLSTQEKYEIVALQQADLTSGVIVADKRTYNLKLKNNIILLRFENLLGEQIQSEKNITASLFLRTEKVIESLTAKNSTDEKFPLALSIPSSAITKAGFYSLRVAVENEEVLEERILFTTSVNLKQVEFEAAQGKGKIPKKYTHSLTAKQLSSNSTQVEKISGNQNSFLYVQFSLDYVKQSLSFTPSQVAVRLRHPTFTGVTHLVEAEYDDVSNVYLAIVDFGDPLTILPYSATYDVELIIADQRLTKPVQKIIAQIDATFKTARNGKTPPNDADFTIPKPIEHIVVDTIQSPPMIFILGFIFMMAITLLSYFAVIHKIKLNNLRLKNLAGIQSIYVILFAGSLLAAFGLLVIFWVKINLLQTMTYIAIGIVPFILIGNAALNSLSQAEKVNDSSDSD